MSNQSSENNKRIAKNTLMLYVRMLFCMFVSFYTSRVILAVLGVTDYGINNVVCGVAGMFTFINTTLAGATSRFLTYDIGVGDIDKLKKTFRAALTIHVFLALIIFILCETVGIWLLETKLVIPEERMFAARIIYQLSVLSTMMMITQVPYNAAIVAHERMDIFAYFGIADVTLKLLIVFMLEWFDFDKLILYGILFFVLSVGMLFAYRLYCSRNFEECRFRFIKDKAMLYPMLSFSIWDLYGNMCVMFKGQGINILQNMFWGPAINAATGIANQIMNAIMGFSRNFTTAVQPQIIKYYAKGSYAEMEKLAIRCSKFSFFLLFMISFPAILKVNDVMSVWLKEVPEYALQFFQLAIIANWIDTMMQPLTMIIHATGRMKRISFISGSIFALSVPITYCLLKLGFNPMTPFFVNILIAIMVYMSNIGIVKKYIPSFNVFPYLWKAFLSPMLIVAIGAVIPFVVNIYMKDDWVAFFVVCFLCVFSQALVMFVLGLNTHERLVIINSLKNKFRKK